MPVTFLTPDQRAQYGRYRDELTAEQLGEHFVLDETELGVIADLRHPHTRLGFALQLCTLKFLGAFLEDPLDVPAVVLRVLGDQLGIRDPASVAPRYLERRETRFVHQRKIVELLGYTLYDRAAFIHVAKRLIAQYRTGKQRPIELFDDATQVLVARRVVLPGVTTLERLVAEVRQHCADRLYRDLSRRLNGVQRAALDWLLQGADGKKRLSNLETLRKPPTSWKVAGMNAALARVETLQGLGVGSLDLADAPLARLNSLTRDALTLYSYRVAQLGEARRFATLLVFAQHLEKSATDDALTIFDTLLTELGAQGVAALKKERLRAARDIDRSALLLADTVDMTREQASNPDLTLDELRAVLLANLNKTSVVDAQRQVRELARGDDETTAAWMTCADSVARFFPRLLATIGFDATPSGKPLLAALNFLGATDGRARSAWKKAPRDFIPKAWEGVVFTADHDLDRKAYQLCAATLLQDALKRREVFAPVSLSFTDPRARLLHGDEWQAVKNDVVRSLDLPLEPAEYIEEASKTLHAKYLHVAARLPANSFVTFKLEGDVLRPFVEDVKAEDTSETLETLAQQLDLRLPIIDLSEMLLETNTFAPFIDEMIEAADGDARRGDIATSICAVLMAEACNIGLRAVARSNVPALTLSRLLYVKQHYVRADTMLRANAKLVEAQASRPLVKFWGGGDVVSADGLRFVVPVKSIVPRPNKKYFGSRRGITLYSVTSDQYTGLHGLVVPGTLRDSLYILSALLEQQTSLEPKQVMSDTAGYSDVVFGLFRLLGFQFSPRLADMEHLRYWRVDKDADYGQLQAVSKSRIDTALIARQWPDVLRLVGSLKLGKVRAHDVVRVLQSRKNDGTLSELGKAVQMIGRIAKTMHLLEYVDNEGYRRSIQTQLNRGEGRHNLARVVCHGHKGEIRKKYLAGMEDQLGALGLVLNVVVLWNTRYMEAALDFIRLGLGEEVLDADLAHLSPLRWAHINVLGRFHFDMPDDVAAGAMRPLRDPDTLDPFELAWLESP